MIRGMESILLSSANAKKLAAFYKEKVGLTFGFEGEMGEGDLVFGSHLKSGGDFVVMDHSKIKGSNK